MTQILTSLPPLPHATGPYPYVQTPQGVISAGDMAQRVVAVRAGLAGCGAAPGARVAMQLQDPLSALAVFYAALGTDLVLVPVHSATPVPELHHILSDSGATMLLTDAPVPDAALPTGTALQDIGDWQASSASGETPGPALNPAAPAVILYTSGTTGAPKGVVFSHVNLDQIATHFPPQVLDLGPKDTLFLPIELNSPIGVVLAVSAHRAGSGLALAGRSDPARIIDRLREMQVTVMLVVPTLAAMLIAATRDRPDPLPHLRHMVLGGNPVTRDLAERITSGLGCRLSVVFAMTELIPGLILRNRADQPDGSVGWPAPGLDAEILGPDGQTVAEGEIGELAVRGAQLQAGYWRGGGIDPLPGPDGWYRTGDLGYREAGGNTVLVGRAKDVILTGGHTVYPPEVEQTLEQHPDVARAALVGRSHRDFGEIVVAFVVPRPGSELTEAALIRWAKTRLQAAKCPRAVRFIDDMPMTGSGKIRKAALRSGLRNRSDSEEGQINDSV